MNNAFALLSAIGDFIIALVDVKHAQHLDGQHCEMAIVLSLLKLYIQIGRKITFPMIYLLILIGVSINISGVLNVNIVKTNLSTPSM